MSIFFLTVKLKFIIISLCNLIFTSKSMQGDIIMFCKYCGSVIDPDSNYCPSCGKCLTNTHSSSKKVTINGKSYSVKNGILYDKDGWDVGRVPSHIDSHSDY